VEHKSKGNIEASTRDQSTTSSGSKNKPAKRTNKESTTSTRNNKRARHQQERNNKRARHQQERNNKRARHQQENPPPQAAPKVFLNV
jgi:hypothetical protein